MDDARFDRFVRMLATRVSRRGAVGVAGTLAIAGIRGASANQLTPSTCGASGDVCTMLMGCCDGLTCVTSAINTNYGVCVAGEGGTVSIGTTLISPFSENVEQEVAAIAASETTSTTTTTDPTLEREQRLAEIKARKDARRTKQQTRRSSRKSDQQTRKETRQFNREERRGPNVAVSITCPQDGTKQTITIRNRSSDDLTVEQITSLFNPLDEEPFLPRTVVEAGTSVEFFVGVPSVNDPLYLGDTPIFDDSPLEGVRVTLDTDHVRGACCDQTADCLSDEADEKRNRKRRRQRNRGNNKN